MTSVKWIWSDKRLTLDTELCTYKTLVLSVLLYVTDTWTLLSADVLHPLLNSRNSSLPEQSETGMTARQT